MKVMTSFVITGNLDDAITSFLGDVDEQFISILVDK
jgi:hypothetical protein